MRLLIIIGILLTFSSQAQNLSKKDFIKTEWFSDNTDSLFFKADTIKLIRYSNIAISGEGWRDYIETCGLNDNQSIKYQFNRNNNLHFWIINYHWGSKSKEKERKWNFDKKDMMLIIYRNSLVEYKFKVIMSKELEFTCNKVNYKTKEILLKKISQQLLTGRQP